MNALSALIYFVGVVDSLGSLALWLVIPGMLACIVVTVVWLIVSGCQIDSVGRPENSSYYTKPEYWTSVWSWWAKGRNIAVTMAVVGWVLYIFLPTRQTLILIAGSELGGKVVNAQSVQAVVDPGLELVKTWIAAETNKLKPAANKKEAQ